MKFFCKNCKHSFYAEGKRSCPRCSSLDLYQTQEDKPKDEAAAKPLEKKPYWSSQKYVEGDSKQTWKDFHKTETRQCMDCGGIEFKLDWKHKEKICLKCGAIMPLGRRMA